jgi:cyclopropane fatty-acyl-phospholipid synthase-like methyltransferase
MEEWKTRGPNSDVARLEPRLRRKSRILDVGAGYGRHAIYLARRGHKVHALEPDSQHRDELERRISDADLDIQIKPYRVENVPLSEKYHAIIMVGVLQHIPAGMSHKTVKRLQDATTLEGYHIIVSPMKEWLSPECVGELYRDWIPIRRPEITVKHGGERFLKAIYQKRRLNP